MKKQLSKIALGVALLTAVTGFSQGDKIQPCNTYAAMEYYWKTTPGAKEKFDAAQADLQEKYLQAEKAKASGTNKTAAVQYTVPVVFHVLHKGGPENITDAQCISALNQMNSDYGRMNADTNTIFAPFKSLYINSDIKFMLAHKDPSGNCTSGIEHIYNLKTDWDQTGANSASYYSGICWDPTKYLNIIIVKQIIPTGTVTGGGTIVGYTHLPGQYAAGDLRDAIVYNNGFLSGTNARSLSHEAGHWFSLAHTFGNTNNPGVVCGSSAGGDGVSDTPDTKGNFSTCPASSTNTNYICTSPNPGNPNNYYQNVENIMDYSSCPKNFTSGQTTKMRTALASPTAGRSNIISAGNHIATDVDGLGNCTPIANFLPFLNSNISYSVCSGGSLVMKDFSYNAVITGYAWAADNGAVIAASTASTTSISFPNQGITTITLTVSNAQGSNVKVIQVMVLNGTAVITGNYMESFETPNVTPPNWSVGNPDAAVTWAQNTLSARNGVGSFYIDGSTDQFGQVDYLYMPVMDVVNNPNNIFTFSYAYARKTSAYMDKLVLQGSLDCGANWKDVVNLNAASMAANSGGVDPNPFIPGASQWVDVDVTQYPYWSDYMNTPSASFRFVFTEDPLNGNGNNIFLDAVNFTSPNGLNELTKIYKLNIFPNPSNGEVTIKFNLNDAATVGVNVVDVLGRDVLPATSANYGGGDQSIAINKNSTLSKGIYFVNLNINGTKLSKKLVIN
ncbi:MAG: T9SS type A sorting domain-containing protein [Bacteroidetes bacterium]|nr:T9SS type A sorting domain-containing protein [Bacteroidota bacterium]